MRIAARCTLPRKLLVGSTGVLAVLISIAETARPARAEESSSGGGSSSSGEKDEDLPKEFRFDFGLFAGGHFFTKDHGLGRYDTSPTTPDSDNFSPAHGPAFGGRLGLNFNRYVTLEVEALAIPTHTVNNATKMYVFGYRGSLLIHFAGQGAAFRPFIDVGYGALTSVINDDSALNALFAGGDTDGMLHGGLGFKIAIGNYFGLRFDGRVLAPPSFLGDTLPVGDETGFGGPDFEALGGIFFNFGEVERAIYKKEVIVQKAPPAPPSPDPDGDGILGKADKCPTVPEDRDGFEDEDGCPELDNDGDGISDALDKCPMKPETKNGIDDEDGCPEEDKDGDGIIGSRDHCPDEPETKNNFQDEDGCPDEIPVVLKKFTGVIEGINFKTGSSSILPGSYPILDRAVAVLKEYPDVRLEISGHTDSRGKPDYNRDLSQQRADSVKNYFIANGIDAGRLTSIGYGMDRAIADNKTNAGRAKNRRTEFRLISAEEAGGAKKPAP